MSSSPRPRQRLCFVDDRGGALASLAAGIAHALGYMDALATTTSKYVDIPGEIATVLAEIGATPAPIEPVFAVPLEGVEHVRIGAGGWDAWLVEGGELERLSAARIARDRIERKLDPRPLPTL